MSSQKAAYRVQVWALMPLALSLNLCGGYLVQLFKIPLYFDSFGTLLVAGLLGPVAGLMTGILSNMCWVLAGNPLFVPYAVVSGALGAMAGYWGRLRRLHSFGATILCGLLMGVVCALISAPITYYLYGGVSGGSSDLLVALGRSMGLGPILAVFAQSLTMDPLDKVFTLLLARQVFLSAPRRVLGSYRNIAGSWSLGGPSHFRFASYQPVDLEPGQKSVSVEKATIGGLYWESSKALHHSSGLAKLLLAFVGVVGVWWFPSLGFSHDPSLWLPQPTRMGLLYFAPLLLLTLLSGRPWKLVKKLLWLWMPLALSSLLINTLWGEGLEVYSLGILGEWSFSVTGWQSKWGLLGRVFAVLWWILWYLHTTSLQQFGYSLERLGIPPAFAYALQSGLGLMEQMQDNILTIRQAQALKGLGIGRGWASQVRALLGMLHPLTLNLLQQVQRRTYCLALQNYDSVGIRTHLYVEKRGEVALFLLTALYASWLAYLAWIFYA